MLAIGDSEILRVIETEQPEFEPTRFYPDCTWEMLEPHRGWLEPRFLDPATRKLVFAIQSYVVRTPQHTILIDSCVGEHKERSYSPDWHMRSGTRYLAGLAAAGIAPEEVDVVMCTHLHPDHVGWNTQLVDGRWVPTFARARYVFAATEYDFWRAKSAKDPRKYDDGAFADSVLPVVEAGRADIVADDHAVDDRLRIEPAPGHTPGHSCIRLASPGGEALFTGDMMHSVLQLTFPDLASAACFDKPLAAATRRAFLDSVCDRDVLVLPGHFPSPSAGRVVADGDTFAWRYA
jgi:glyoxylase-like metal-dependent hydrolase (beta-lactamase superfamily II)